VQTEAELDDVTLPSVDDAGSTAEWPLRTDSGVENVLATFLGLGTSRSGDHRGHAPGTVQPRRPKHVRRHEWSNCHACRWTEVRIFKSEQDGVFLVYTVGRSLAADEGMRTTLAWASTPADLFEALQIRPDGMRQRARLSVPATQALEMAAGHDQRLYRELVQRNATRG
jgi:hypothetical protein